MQWLGMALVVLAFLPVLRGLYLQIRKKYEGDLEITRVTPLFMYSNLWRYEAWVLWGAVMLHFDVLTALLFLVTRFAACLLVWVTFLQRINLTPSRREIVRFLAPRLLILLAIVGGGVALGQMNNVPVVAKGLVIASFVVYTLIALPREIHDVRSSKNYRRLRKYQVGLLLNHVATLTYSFVVPDASVGWFLRIVSLLALAGQLVLVVQIELGTRAYRKQRKLAKAKEAESSDCYAEESAAS